MEAMKKATTNKKTALRVVRVPPEAGTPYVMDEVLTRLRKSKLFGFDGNSHLSLVDNNYNRYLTYLYLRVSSHSALSLSLKQVLCCFLMFDHLLLQSFSKISLALKITNLVDVVDYFWRTYACSKVFLHITKHWLLSGYHDWIREAAMHDCKLLWFSYDKTLTLSCMTCSR